MVVSTRAAEALLCFFMFASLCVRSVDTRLVNARIRHSDIGKLMDKVYCDAGTRVDIVKFDLRELKRQGVKNLDAILRDVEIKDREMRGKWVALDKERAAIFADILSTPLSGGNMLTFELLDAYSGYLHIYKVKLKWPDGRDIELSPDSFRQGLIKIPSYSSKFFKLWNNSFYDRASVGFDLPGNQVSQDQNGNENGDGKHLQISNETPTELTVLATGLPSYSSKCGIRISLNGHTVFEGNSPFHGRGGRQVWKTFKVPSGCFTNKNVPNGIWSTVSTRLDALERDVRSFGVYANGVADNVERKTRDIRKGLVYEPLVYPKDWWRKSFLRGMCVRTDTYNYEKRANVEPWYYNNYEYMTKAFRDAGVNLVYSYSSGKSEEMFLEALDKVGIPCVEGAFEKGRCSIKAMKYFSDPDQRVIDVLKYVEKKAKKFNCLRGVLIDEPCIIDDSDASRGVCTKKKSPSNVATYDKVLAEFRDYINSRRGYLEKNGVVLPKDVEPVTKIEKESDLPLWMEWQIFKKNLMGDSYMRFSDALSKKGLITLPIIMDYSLHRPQKCSYVSMGTRLPMISTDLYDGGSVVESMSMQLLKHAAIGKAYMTTGAGYSCKTPLQFKRTLAISMMQSDGDLQWVYQYCSKYRDPYAFRKGRLTQNFSRDDRYRHTLENWRPEYWGIQLEMTEKMRKAGEWLVDTASAANLAILTSERLAIAKSSSCSFFPCFPKRVYDLSPLYICMLRRNRPLDFRYLETTNKDDLKKYKVVFLNRELILTADEIAELSAWVDAGGVLIATGETSLYDEWGRKRKNFGLNTLFGADYLDTVKGGGKFVLSDGGKSVACPTTREYVKVNTCSDVEIAARWKNGDPAMIIRKKGKGGCVYLSLKSFRWAPVEPVELESFLRGLVNKEIGCEDPVTVLNAPPELEVQIRRKGESYVIHLLDWKNEERVLNNIKMKINLRGDWNVKDVFNSKLEQVVKSGDECRISPFKQYSITVLSPKR